MAGWGWRSERGVRARCVYNSKSVRTRFLTPHQIAPHRFDRRRVTLASPVMPGRQRAPPRMPTRASTAPAPRGRAHGDAADPSGQCAPVGMEHQPRALAGAYCVAPAPASAIRISSESGCPSSTAVRPGRPSARSAARAAGSPRSRAPAPAWSGAAARRGHAVEPRRLGRALGLKPRHLAGPVRPPGLGTRGPPASPPGAPVSSGARSRSRSRTWSSGIPGLDPRSLAHVDPPHDARCPGRSARPTAPAPPRRDQSP